MEPIPVYTTASQAKKQRYKTAIASVTSAAIAFAGVVVAPSVAAAKTTTENITPFDSTEINRYIEVAHFGEDVVGGDTARSAYDVKLDGDSIAYTLERGDTQAGSGEIAVAQWIGPGKGDYETITIKAPSQAKGFGYSVALNDETGILVVGARYSNEAFVYVRSAGTWSTTPFVITPKSDDRVNAVASFGESVAISDEFIVIGAPNSRVDGKVNAGAAYVVPASDAAKADTSAGSMLLPAADVSADDIYGQLVTVTGNTAVISAPQHEEAAADGNRYQIGQISSWDLASSTLTFSAAPDVNQVNVSFPEDLEGGSWAGLGRSVAIAEDGRILAGSPTEMQFSGDEPGQIASDESTSQGAVYVYNADGTFAGKQISELPHQYYFGASVDFNDVTGEAFVGSLNLDAPENKGNVQVFDLKAPATFDSAKPLATLDGTESMFGTFGILGGAIAAATSVDANGLTRNRVVVSSGGGVYVFESLDAITLNKSTSLAPGNASPSANEGRNKATYTVSFKNTTGSVLENLVITDDLSNVLDDAVVTDIVASFGEATLTDSAIIWNGTLTENQEVTITYVATVNDQVVADDENITGYDHAIAALVNSVSASQNIDGKSTALPSVREEADAPNRDKWTAGVVVTTPIDGALKLEKSASDANGNNHASPSENISYVVTAENVGGLPLADAKITDDLTGVLDYASEPHSIQVVLVDRNGAQIPAPEARFSDSMITWIGDVPAGAKLTISYEVKVKTADEIYPLQGGESLINTVESEHNVVPEGPVTETPIEDELVLTKTATPDSGSQVKPGEQITYTLTLTNKDQDVAKSNITLTDDLSVVLPYAQLIGEPTSDALIDGETLTWTGDVEAGGIVEISYTVQVLDSAPNNVIIGNHVTSADVREDPPGTEHEVDNPRGTVHLEKTSDPAEGSQVKPGDVITYTVKITNESSLFMPAVTVTDVVSGPATVMPGSLPQGATLDGKTITWTGNVEANQTVELTYQVVVDLDATAPAVVGNVVTSDDMSNTPEEVPSTEHPVRTVVLAKTSTPETGSKVKSGDFIKYKVTATNPSESDFKDVTVTDDLSGILNNATLTSTLENVIFDEATNTLTWNGDIAAGQTITFEYEVMVNDVIVPEGATLRNLVTSPDSPDSPVTEHITENDRGTVTLAKSADPAAGSIVRPGEHITYTVTVSNDTPRVIRDVRVVDNVTDVLAHATLDLENLPEGMTLVGNELVWVGDVAGNETFELVYTATVNEDATAPAVIRNVVTSSDMSNEPEDPPSTQHPVGTVELGKSSKPASGTGVVAGEEVTYTVTVRNPAQTAITDVVVVDDLSEVLDKATLVDGPTRGATIEDAILTWEGDLAAGEIVEIVYSVIVNEGVFEGTLRNVVVSSDSPSNPETVNPVGSVDLTKSVSIPQGTAANMGDLVTYTVTVSNNSGVAVKGASFVDDLSDVLDNAVLDENSVLVNGTGKALVEGKKIVWSGDLADGESTSVSYTVRVNDDVKAGESLRNVVTSPQSPEVPSTETPIGVVELSKTSIASPEGAVKPGSDVAYTVTITNPSDVAINNVEVTDDMTQVLAHATIKSEPSASTGTLTQNGGFLTWTGSVSAQSSVTITYTVTVNEDVVSPAVLKNVVTSPDSPETPETEDPIGTLELDKKTDVAEGESVRIGDEITYTVTATNKSGTDLLGVLIEDDLSDVLDNATVVDGPSSGASIEGTLLTWTGDIKDGDTVKISYTVKVKDDVTGAQSLRNVVTSPDSPQVPETENPIGSVNLSKTSNPATGAGVKPGDTVTYTVTVSNTSKVDMTGVKAVDDLSGVLAHAKFLGDPIVTGSGVATFDAEAQNISWTGDVKSGEAVTITYSVKVKSDVVSGQSLKNVVVSPDSPDVPETENPVSSINLAKSVKPGSGEAVKPGQEVTYTVTASNDSEVDALNVSIADELSDVLDDATLVEDSIKVSDGSTAAIVGTTLVWNGTVPAKSELSIEYTFIVNKDATAPSVLRNLVTSPHSPDEPETENPVGTLLLSKANNKGDGAVVKPGEVVDYTVTITNPSKVELKNVTVSDDLSDVLNNASWTDNAAASAGEVVLDGNALRWTGTVPAQGIVTVTYSVKMKDTAVAPATIRNLVSSPDSPVVPEVENPVGTVHLTKTSDPASGTAVKPGQSVKYSVSITNPAEVEQENVLVTDNLAEVLGSATLVGEPVVSDGSSAKIENDQLTWTGNIAAKSVITIEYEVKVNADAVAPATLKNLVTSPDSTDVPETENPVGTVVLDKSVNPSNGTSVKAGDLVEYTVTIKNPVAADVFDVKVVDDLSGVLGSATLVDGPTVDAGNAVFDGAASTITWTGDVSANQTVTVKYSVKVKDDVAEGDTLRNLVTSPDSPNVPETENPVGDLTVAKRLLDSDGDPVVSGTIVAPGQELTYEIIAKNTKTEAAAVDLVDDLSDVLDDAELVGAPQVSWTAEGTVPGLSFANQVIRWNNEIPAGATLTISYTIKTDSQADGTEILANAVKVNGNEGPGTEHEVGTLDLTKSVSPANGTAVKPGERATYTVTVSNLSNAAIENAQIVDDLSDVLDNASLVGEVTVSDGSTAQVAGTKLTWTGDVPADSSLIITYTVEVNEDAVAPATLRNLVTSPNSPDVPETENPVGTVSLKKDSNPKAGSAVKPGAEVEYTVTVTNDTAAMISNVSVTDDLADVVDDATLDKDSVKVSDGSDATVTDNKIFWNGDVPANTVITITYKVTVNDDATAPATLKNLVASPDSPDEPETENPVGTLHLTKSSNPGTGSSVKPGDVVKYEVRITNNSSATIFDARVVDNLFDVLDNATLKGDIKATSGSVTLEDHELKWTGDVEAGKTVTLSYAVVVDEDAVAPSTLRNIVMSPDSPMEPETENPVAVVELNKSSNPGSGVSVKPGDVVDYTITVTNPGEVDMFNVYVEDNLSDVLDNAELVGEPQASDGSKVVVSGMLLAWTGDVPAGQTVAITYKVKVLDSAVAPETLRNVVASPHSPDEPNTENPVGTVSLIKTSDPASGTVVKHGQEVTYSVLIENGTDYGITGVVVRDDLSDVLDDAVLIGEPQASDGSVVSVNKTELTWSGDVPANSTVELTYTVQVTVPKDQDGSLRNVVVSPHSPDKPITVNPVPSDPDPGITPDPDEPAEPGPSLPVTGAELAGIVLAALVLLAIGGALIATKRKREDTSDAV